MLEFASWSFIKELFDKVTKKIHSAKMRSTLDPPLPNMWLALRVGGILPLPIKHNLLATNHSCDVRMNDSLGYSRTNRFMKIPSNWTLVISVIRPDGDVTRAANIKAVLAMKSWCYLLVTEHSSRTEGIQV